MPYDDADALGYRSYRCPRCRHHFSDDCPPHECPRCGYGSDDEGVCETCGQPREDCACAPEEEEEEEGES